MKRTWPLSVLVLPALLVTALLAAGQQKQKADEKDQKKDPSTAIAPLVRLAAAKTAFLKRAGSGSNIPYDLVSESLDGWRRFTLVNELEKADVIIEVFCSEDNDVAAATTVRTSPQTGRPERSASTSKQFAAPEVRLTIYDAKTNLPLWTATEHPRYALKKKDIENHEVEAAQRLVTRLHDQLEPPQKQ